MRSIVDAVAEKNGVRSLRLLPGSLQFLFRALIREHFLESDALGQVAHLAFAVAGQQYRPSKWCFGFRWRMKVAPSERVRRGIARWRHTIIDQDDASMPSAVGGSRATMSGPGWPAYLDW